MKYTLDELVTLIMDYRGKTPKKLGLKWSENNNEIPAISAKNIKNGELINIDKSHYGDDKLYKVWMKDGSIEINDILLTSEAPLGESYLVTKPLKAILSQRTFLLRPNIDIISPWYFFALTQSKSFQKKLFERATGTTVIGIKQKDLRKIEIDLPNKNDQRKIGNYFRVITEKISLNKQINDNLLGQLKVISDNYFSYFTFNKGIVPDDWEYKKLTDVAEITTGYSYTGKELVDSNIGMATIKNFTRNGGFRSEGYKPIVPSKNVKKDKYVSLFDMLVAHTDLTQNADIIGNAEPVLTTNSYEKTIYSMDLVKVVPKQDKISKWLLDLVLMSSRVKFHCLSYVNGTTVLHLSKKALREFEIPLPKDYKELENIIDLTKNYLTTVSKNIQENSKLNEIKNQLLNKYF